MATRATCTTTPSTMTSTFARRRFGGASVMRRLCTGTTAIGFSYLSRYHDVLQAVLDTNTFSSAHGTTADGIGPEPVDMSMMIFMDPPEHTWHRRS
jgi:cytochrome P450